MMCLIVGVPLLASIGGSGPASAAAIPGPGGGKFGSASSAQPAAASRAHVKSGENFSPKSDRVDIQ
jgi:hypothetical protein